MGGSPDLLGIHVRLATIIVLTSCLAAPAQPPESRRPRGEFPVSEFKKSMEFSLAQERTRIREIAEPVLERIRKMRGTSRDLDIQSQRIKVQGAEATYQNAKLTREIAEIAVKEYMEGIYVQDLATVEAEVRLAEEDIKETSQDLEKCRDTFERIKKISTGSMYDTMSVVQFESRLKSAELSKRKAEVQLEQSRSKLLVLREYKKGARTKELQANVEQARSDELQKEEILQIQKAKLVAMKKGDQDNKRQLAKYQPVLSLLADAVRLDGEVRDKLAKLDPKNRAPQSDSRRKIEEQARTLGTKVNEAGRLFENLKFAELASEINFAATRPLK